MKNLYRLLYFIGLFSAFSLAIAAQTPQPSPTPLISNDTGAVQTFEVRLPVTVVEKKKKKNLVAGLMQSDFSVFEDGVQQKVTFFTDEKTKTPIYVGVLMDTSPSTAGKMGFSKAGLF